MNPEAIVSAQRASEILAEACEAVADPQTPSEQALLHIASGLDEIAKALVAIAEGDSED